MSREREKGIFLTQNNLRTPYPFALKSDQNAEIRYTNHIPPRRFQGASRYCDMDF